MKTTAHILLALLPLFLSGSCSNSSNEALEDRIDRISRAELESVVQLFGDDLLEGRAPGTRGGRLAEVSLQSLCKFLDLGPGIDDGYFQPFVMKGFTNEGFLVNANGVNLEYKEDIVGTFTVEEEEVELDGEAVFVGFGVSTGIWDWDDYKDVDMSGKIVITRVNDPGLVNPEIFEGNTLTYFGRWTCHIEEAARRGAAGILLIHTDETAGYDWNVVKNSWSGEELFIDTDLQNSLKFRGWIKESSLRVVLARSGLELDKLYEEASTTEFQPVELGF